MNKRTIKVLLVDDSPFTLEFLKGLLESDPEIKVMDTADNGAEGLEKAISLLPDVVVMDIEMPLMDGIEATKRIMQQKPLPILILTSSLNTRHLYRSLDAIKYGALEILNKPTPRPTKEWQRIDEVLVQTIKKVAFLEKGSIIPSLYPGMEADYIPASDYSAIGIASSTGGPTVLNTLFTGLTPAFPLPILVAQHISEGFVQGLVDWLSKQSSMTFKVGEEGEPLKGGTVYFAPTGAHIAVQGSKLKLLFSGPVRGILPSGNLLLESLAHSFGNRSMGMILTGMGNDGREGANLIHSFGGLMIAQEPASAVVSSMPMQIIKEKMARYILTPLQINGALMAMERGENL